MPLKEFFLWMTRFARVFRLYRQRENLQFGNFVKQREFSQTTVEEFNLKISKIREENMNYIKKLGLTLIILTIGLLQTNVFAQSEKSEGALWQKISKAELNRLETLSSEEREQTLPTKYLVYKLNQNLFSSAVADAPLEFQEGARMKRIILELPTPDGDFMRFYVEESPILSPKIAAEFPDWKTFQGYGVDDPTASVRFGITSNGFHATILSTKGTIVIDPYKFRDMENYITYFKADSQVEREFHCKIDEGFEKSSSSSRMFTAAPQFTHGTQIRTFRLAIAATGEYTEFFGSQNAAFAAVTTTINRVVGIYRRDFASSLQLVSGMDTVFPDKNTDPYDNSTELGVNQTVLDNVIGNANYDIGHLFITSGGGLASIRSVCDNANKAQGASGLANPVGDPFDVDYVAHEIGHQFGGNHTFNAEPNCGASPQAARREPGSGVTIIGYAGICSSVSNLQRNSIDNFHVYTQTEIIDNLTTGAGSTCGTVSGANAVPVVTAPAAFTIPKDTPFTLTAAATDGNNDALTYSWEQNEAGTTVSNYPAETDDDDTNMNTGRPLFRSYSPTTSPSRTFPSLTYILNNANQPPLTYTGTSAAGSVCNQFSTCITGEDLPSVARTMNFSVSVRDNKGGTADAATVLTIVATPGAFQVTTQNAANSPNWNANTQQTITWDVNNTNAAPINAAAVNILLSTDGGQTFPTTLAANTPNDGTEQVTIPNVTTTQARIKIEAVGNIFFDINNADFQILAPTAASVSISGRVLTAFGRGVSRTIVSLTDTRGRVKSARTNQFGYYRFTDVEVGETYIINARHKNYKFRPQAVSINDSLTNMNLIAERELSLGNLKSR